MENKLTFDNLHELLHRFSTMNDVNKKYAHVLTCVIDNGMY